ncbi:S9 family peptidase [Parapedobacter koreensis]|uniref:Dipeptidyl-peptidase-4 n=1 Tax=Parapedobacter koreensis TaxID=332977 RepID=A0A1H7PHL0_9SPHI|nr:S9 family peptidase [Parapedobacter koreensis]SEL35116.1 dipeptidyl-peptidase-4 [Parapedobacter koreensis]
MHKKIYLAIGVFLVLGHSLSAQTKRLDLEQSLGAKPSLTKPINRIVGWADADHYIESDVQARQQYQVHVKTGERNPYTPPPSSDVDVYVQDNDIFIRQGANAARQLTHSPEDEEKNPTLSPDNQYVAFTRNNDLYAIQVSGGREIRYTTDATDVIYNGWASWVYFEEILGRATRYKAFWWSPDSKTLAFMRFDDTQVPMFPIYGAKGQHGYLEQTRYPKAGDPNPEVRVGFVPVEGGNVIWADFNEKDDQYFGEPYWSFDSGNLMVQWMNRDQTNLKFYQVDPKTGSKNAIYDEHQNAWIDLSHSERITYLKDNKHYILKSDKTGWAHYYLYTLDGTLVNPITEGKWQVSALELVDEKNKVVYFTARKEHSATVDLYRVDYSGKNMQRLTFGDYTHQVAVSPDGKHFITTYSNVSTPSKVALLDNKGKLIKELADSKADDFDEYKYAKTELITIPTPDGYALPATITWPTDFDETKPYPVIFSIYGGPDAGTVRNTWKDVANQHQHWANEGIIQISVDHRASGHFGKEGVALMHRNLGHWEMIDYITAAKWLKDKPWVAKDKLLITGHSYGGYMTCLALTKGADYFDYGIAGAPVTSWDLYDTHYTERYMDTPQDNPDGYKNGSVLTYVKNYKGRLRILHGDVDDNVHMQNTTQLVDALTNGDTPFELMIYPGSRHGFAREKSAYDRKERYRFYYQYLLEKPMPAGLK